MDKRGYIQVYTGNGKGKTTAAIGLSIRAMGAGQRVLFLQFMKVPNYSEHRILSQFEPQLTLKTWGKPCFLAKKSELPEDTLREWEKSCVVFEKGQPPAEYVALLEEGLAYGALEIRSGEYDLVVLDELNMAIYFELLALKDVLAMLEHRHPKTEVVITGRNCPQELLDYADLVTEMKEIKHYYTQGVEARVGIES